MKNYKKILTTALVSSILFSSAYAATRDVAVGPTIGSLGLGLEARTKLADTVIARIGFNYVSSNRDHDHGGVSYYGGAAIEKHKSKYKFSSLIVPIIIDWHPVADSGFRFSTGIAYNDQEEVITTSSTGTVNNALVESASSTHTLSSSPIAGIITIGYDNSLIYESNWSWNFELGVKLSGTPKLSEKFKGDPSQFDEASYNRLQKTTKSDINNSKSLFKIYPVLSLGLKYSF